MKQRPETDSLDNSSPLIDLNSFFVVVDHTQEGCQWHQMLYILHVQVL